MPRKLAPTTVLQKEHTVPKEIAITWACNKIYHTNDITVGFKLAVDILKNIKKVSNNFILYPEVGMNGNNLHFHGKIHIDDQLKWFKSVLPLLKRHGFVKIKRITTEGWIEYCKKDWELMSHLFDIDEPITYEYIKRFITINKIKKTIKYECKKRDIIDMCYKEGTADSESSSSE